FESPVESPPPSKKSRIEDDSKDSSPVPAPDVEELIKALQELEESASQDAAVREKIANLPAEEFRGKLEKVTIVRKELKSHLDNLPDLSKLPDVDGGLAPLPSAGDLFASSSGHRS
ncbi:predicted protein, partial [Nematostella vectensis]